MSNKEKATMLEEISEQLSKEAQKFSIALNNNGKITSVYEIETKINNIYEFDVNKFLPNATAMTLDKFYELVAELIRNAQVQDGIIEDEIIAFTEEYTPEEFHNFGDEVIVFRLLKREPARMDSKGTSRPQRNSMHSYEMLKPNFPNKSIIVESRPIDHIIELTCWAKTNRLANKRAIWLEKLLINNSWVFETQGVERFYWEGRGPDTYMTSGEQRLFYRPLKFFVRFREFEAKLYSVIKDIEIIYGGN